MAKILKAYSKRFAASVTDFGHKYALDPFFRTEVHVVLLQAIFALLLLVVLATTAKILYHDASAALSRGIAEALLPGSVPQEIGASVIAELDYKRSRTVALASALIIVVTLILSYIITRIALLPTRNALESQKQFIGNVAHEIRTPLSIIKTNTEVALMAEQVEPELEKILSSTVEELDRISEIINNLLSLSTSIRPEHLEFKNIDLGVVMETVLGKLRGLINSKQVEIRTRMSEHRSVWGNMTALEQVAMNILKNAVSYSSRGGEIHVTIEPVHPNTMEFTVQDFGVGIARKDLFRIFEPYYRGDPSRQRGVGGSGLGLTIVSELVKLHNGKVSVRSAEGRGTTVTIHLPAGRERKGGNGSQKSENVSEVAVDFSHR
ncbi:HAMP domain-containing histidine kinase [Candidatus Kaiserbacteria bacterium]|nr:HAMP domain-containing histidine kinase [Candidatus Kaiserbacteria bacterium]